MVIGRHILHHRRLYIAGAAGMALGVFLPSGWSAAVRVIAGWDAAALLYLALVARMMATSGAQHMRQRATVEDEGRWAVLAVTSGAALASLAAIGMLLSGAKDLPVDQRPEQLALGAVTIPLSWLFVHTVYAVHYAYDHYRGIHLAGQAEGRGGLGFPDTTEPDYWDFCYFAFTIGMTAQTSDVSVNGRAMRRLTLLHGIVSFCFNTVLLALAVNIAAALL